ncbi:MAG: DegT/DnrJ/EryC1/StrS family aminotransferase [Candidatus Hydrogenedentes bacterium]|nr:DegT/DnrJ/EryC1/StrS family aminotransferase [Candidatus Hydrogenedentota bacterium]
MPGRPKKPFRASAKLLAEGLPSPFPRTLAPNALKYLREVVDSGMTTDMMGRFEKAFAEALGVQYCIATPGCTPALHGLFLACDFAPGDEVIVSPITDYGTVQGLLAQDLIPVFPDTPPGNINFSAETIAPCLGPRTRAILCVHKTGIFCDMDPINALAAQHGLMVFEDCCQAVFGQYKARLAGTLGHAACFSFDPEKTMGSDTGGCMVTNDPELHERARYCAQNRAGTMRAGFGRVHTDVGYAYRMPQCTAAICLAQLEHVREWVAHRDKMARLTYRLLSEIPGITPVPIPGYVDVFSCWMMGFNLAPGAFRCPPAEFAATLANAGISTASLAEYYLMPAALEVLQRKTEEGCFPYSVPPASRTYTYSAESCPNARDFLKTFIRWVTFCEKWQPEHCALAADIVRETANHYRA